MFVELCLEQEDLITLGTLILDLLVRVLCLHVITKQGDTLVVLTAVDTLEGVLFLHCIYSI